MNLRKNLTVMFAGAMAAALAGSANATTVTISGTSLSGLYYDPNGGTAAYVAGTGGTPDVAHLYTSDSGTGSTAGAPGVFVTALNAGPLGTLGSFSASYDLFGAASGPAGTAPY